MSLYLCAKIYKIPEMRAESMNKMHIPLEFHIFFGNDILVGTNILTNVRANKYIII